MYYSMCAPTCVCIEFIPTKKLKTTNIYSCTLVQATTHTTTTIAIIIE